MRADKGKASEGARSVLAVHSFDTASWDTIGPTIARNAITDA
jgi:hypothetical protein